MNDETPLKELAMLADNLIERIKKPTPVPEFLRKELSRITLDDAIFDRYEKGLIKELPKEVVNRLKNNVVE